MSAGTARYPAVDLLVQKATAARSVADALLELAKAGRLADLERDIAAMRRDTASGLLQLVKGPSPAGSLAKGAAPSVVASTSTSAPAAVSKADEYQQKAMAVSDPQLRKGYFELAERERAGTR